MMSAAASNNPRSARSAPTARSCTRTWRRGQSQRNTEAPNELRKFTKADKSPSALQQEFAQARPHRTRLGGNGHDPGQRGFRLDGCPIKAPIGSLVGVGDLQIASDGIKDRGRILLP